MADRVHPVDIPSTSNPPSSNNSGEVVSPKQPPYPSPAKPVPPPPGTYVVQVPKDQIYKYPPPENSRRYESLTKRKPQRSCCCRCLCFTLIVFLVSVIVLGVTAGVLYAVYRPESPKYTISSIAIKNFNFTSATSTISPGFDIAVRAENPNDKIGIYYMKGSSVTVVYSGVDLSTGVLPAFFQPANNVTVFKTALKGSKVMLGSAVKSTLMNEQRKRKVPFRVNIKAPVKIKIGAVKTWEITVKVNCGVTVDALTVKSKLVSKDCDYSVRLW
ncbi:NDR1/HIN1-like protein 13 [Nicotiana tabacum]|uniref:Protein YLS9 n=2 Tax=Nicotiana TaxID=4085 RepID=A0A1S4B2V6_TOBAC|nr:PREDICTED: protein YLS9-like [Nicotiana sylvestris]XP_009788479.1 PREDICTED: protein YLS9-like [Nicotiana sylvestris]XP_016483123.1 PREDICTED: protein YLS9-like [Nicotiana tabacum]XP_016483124.1 PREDICTED: protein YLS9-like [Nicotiana tabacum]